MQENNFSIYYTCKIDMKYIHKPIQVHKSMKIRTSKYKNGLKGWIAISQKMIS